MDLLLDIHTHSLASGHAYSTISENLQVAKQRGLQIYGISDHAVSMPGSAHSFYFQNLRVIPSQIDGITVLKGIEANILDYDGTIDVPSDLAQKLDYVIASMHMPCIGFGSCEQNTRAIIKAIENPDIQVIGHPDDGRYPMDYEKIVKAAKQHHTLLEMNNSSLDPNGFRQQAAENYRQILQLCERYQVPIVVSSDAHFATLVGEFGAARQLLDQVGFPADLVINTKPDQFLEYIKKESKSKKSVQNILFARNKQVSNGR